MSVKLSGAEFKRYYADPAIWVDGSYHDETVILIDGKEHDGESDLSQVADDAMIEVQSGYIYLPGGEEDLVDHLIRWQRQQSARIVLVEIPADRYAAVVAAIVAAGGKVQDSLSGVEIKE